MIHAIEADEFSYDEGDRNEVLYRSERTLIYRVRRPHGGGSIICKEPLGPSAMKRRRHELEILERAADADEAPVRADVDVQRRLRRRVQAGPDDLADTLRGLARSGKRVLWMRERVERPLRERDPGPHRAEQAGGQELGDAGL